MLLVRFVNMLGNKYLSVSTCQVGRLPAVMAQTRGPCLVQECQGRVWDSRWLRRGIFFQANCWKAAKVAGPGDKDMSCEHLGNDRCPIEATIQRAPNQPSWQSPFEESLAPKVADQRKSVRFVRRECRKNADYLSWSSLGKIGHCTASYLDDIRR
jgi:hypothetical protein